MHIYIEGLVFLSLPPHMELIPHALRSTSCTGTSHWVQDLYTVPAPHWNMRPVTDLFRFSVDSCATAAQTCHINMAISSRCIQTASAAWILHWAIFIAIGYQGFKSSALSLLIQEFPLQKENPQILCLWHRITLSIAKLFVCLLVFKNSYIESCVFFSELRLW